ncbi:MAG TPA: hypothetical protein VGN74_02475 [Brevundimonas sp.]|jgi:hypothetical protein|uniref:hypothetical protein n=1 Tax=Brevundimonas sp. TaxID=1871086 RepID=UPI002E0DDC59|nr:hypothetical protein [Brevundimonas sp.]
MPTPFDPLPPATWDDLETIFDALAETSEQRQAVAHLLEVTRAMSPYLSRLDLLREIICIALVLLPENDRPPSDWPWLRGTRPRAPALIS